MAEFVAFLLYNIQSLLLLEDMVLLSSETEGNQTVILSLRQAQF